MTWQPCSWMLSIVGYQNITTHSCTCRRATQAARQVTYSLRAAGERCRRARLAQGGPPALAGWHLDILGAKAECLRQAGLSRSWQPLRQTVCLCNNCLLAVATASKAPRSCMISCNCGSCAHIGTNICIDSHLGICLQMMAGSTTRWRQPHPMPPGQQDYFLSSTHV